MLTNLSETLILADKYDVPPEDILFLDFSLNGVKFHVPYSRIRFEFVPYDIPVFGRSMKYKVNNYFFALPVACDSYYSIEKNSLIINEDIIGKVSSLAEDTCDTCYPRRGGTVLNLNPNSKSSCSGCKFCHTIQQTAKDETRLLTPVEFQHFLEDWVRKYNLPDLSHLVQVALVTGCFGSEKELIEYLKMIREILSKYNFRGELFYYGSEIISKKALDELISVKPFAICLSLECFDNRHIMLRDIKNQVAVEDAKRILSKAKDNGFRTNFSYILGIEPLSAMERLFEEMFPYINSFPIINIFQIHNGQEGIRYSEAWGIDYYMKAREILEAKFLKTNMRPRPWENYRSLWYLKFGEVVLNGVRTP